MISRARETVRGRGCSTFRFFFSFLIVSNALVLFLPLLFSPTHSSFGSSRWAGISPNVIQPFPEFHPRKCSIIGTLELSISRKSMEIYKLKEKNSAHWVRTVLDDLFQIVGNNFVQKQTERYSGGPKNTKWIFTLQYSVRGISTRLAKSGVRWCISSCLCVHVPHNSIVHIVFAVVDVDVAVPLHCTGWGSLLRGKASRWPRRQRPESIQPPRRHEGGARWILYHCGAMHLHTMTASLSLSLFLFSAFTRFLPRSFY